MSDIIRYKRKDALIEAIQFNCFADIDKMIELWGYDFEREIKCDPCGPVVSFQIELNKGDFTVKINNAFKRYSSEEFYEKFEATKEGEA